MTDTIKRKAAGPLGTAIDKAMAGFLAVAVAFIALAMPSDLFGGLVGSSGNVMRAGVALLGAAMTFLIVAMLLGALGKPATHRKVAGIVNDPPRLRRADAHPDAPSRSPILAGRELGVPLDEFAIEERPAADLAEVENVDFEAEWERPLPGFIDDEPAVQVEPAEWEPIDEMLDPSAFTTATAPEPELQPKAEADESADPVPAAADIPFWVPPGAPCAAGEEAAEAPAVAVEPDPPLAVPFRKRARPPVEADPLAGLTDRLSDKGSESGPVEALVERFESGLARRERPSRRGGEGELDQRLRSALGDLKKMSGRR